MTIYAGVKSALSVPSGIAAPALSSNVVHLNAKVNSLETELAAVKSKHATELELVEAKVKVEMQPMLQKAYANGYEACKQAMKDAREFMRF